MKNLVIIGAGGSAKEILWLIDDLNDQACEINFLGFVDPLAPGRTGNLCDRPILGGWDDVPSGNVYFVCAIGSPHARKKECLEAESRGWRPLTLIHPTAIISKFSSIGEGTAVAARAVVGPDSKIGRHSTLNFGAFVGHDASVGAFCVLSPNACVLGHALLEDGVFMGASSTINVRCKMGPGSRLGASSFLMASLPGGASAIGVPARQFYSAPKTQPPPG